ncbi:hypothetical protein V3H18_05480 [Methylocystis sp. 9N]|uniref:DUF4145 domain-containing protein n=1 Tax=Methylocystis borbori TaxID=3118750 RepID=A0ABU7XF21_9HYPH
MAQKLEINVNIDELAGIADLGVRRAAVFMGLGLNAARRDDFNDYELRKLPIMPGQTGVPIDFVPSGLAEEEVRKFKEHFATWVIGCGLRELLEHYALFLDRVHEACLLVACKNKRLELSNPQKAQKEFENNLGIPRKLDKLLERFRFGPNEADSIKSLYAARNALTHDLGVIKPTRCASGHSFQISWKTFDIFAQGEETGAIHTMPQLIGQKTEEPMIICGKAVMRERAFPVGSNIVFSQQDLWEICSFFRLFAIPSTRNGFLEFLKAEGVPIRIIDPHSVEA